MAYSPNSDKYIVGAATQTASGNNILLSTAGTTGLDTLGFRSFSVQINVTGTVSSGVVTFEGSNVAAGPYVTIGTWDLQATGYSAAILTTYSPATGVSRYFGGPLNFRYIQYRISTVIGGGGSLQAFTILKPTAFAPHQMSVDQTRINSLAPTQDIGNNTSGTPRVIVAGQALNHRFASAANNNSANVKSSAGRLWSIQAVNINAAIRYLKLYDKATAPTVGTDTPIMTIPLPANGVGVNITLPAGLIFTLGLGRAVVTGATDADNTATAANEQFVSLQYN